MKLFNISFSLFLFNLPFQLTNALNIVIFSQGGPEELALCTAKRYAQYNFNNNNNNDNDNDSIVSLVTTSDKSTQKRQYQYLYGRDTDPEESTRPPVSKRVQLISSGEEIAQALEPADAFLVISQGSPVKAEVLKPAFSYTTEKLKRVVLLSRQDAGSTDGGGGFFGMGGGSNNYAKAEKELETLVKSTHSECSFGILRCGTLKGGGPGFSNLGGRLKGCEEFPELGLSTVFYKNNFDLANSMTTIAHDKFTLKPTLQKGDPNKMPNGFMVTAKKDSIEASPTETNVCTAAVVATAMVEMGFNEEGGAKNEDIEISLGCDKSEVLPTVEEIIEMMKAI